MPTLAWSWHLPFRSLAAGQDSQGLPFFKVPERSPRPNRRMWRLRQPEIDCAMPALYELESLAVTPSILESPASLESQDSSTLDQMGGKSGAMPNPQLSPDERVT